MQSKMGYVLLMVAVMIGSRVCGVEAASTCGDILDGSNEVFDCEGVTNDIDANPTTITCETNLVCGSGECCTVVPAVVNCDESGNTAADCNADCTATYTETTAASGGGTECVGAYTCEAGDGDCPAAAVVNCDESGNTAADCNADCTATYTETTAASGGGTACVGAYTCESGDGDCFSCTSYAAVDEDDSSWTASGVETCEEGVKFCVFVKVDDIAGIACDGGADEVSVCEQAAFKEGCSVTRNEMVLSTKCFDSDQGVTSYADYKSTMDDITKKCDGVGAHGLNAAVLMLALFGYSFSQ